LQKSNINESLSLKIALHFAGAGTTKVTVIQTSGMNEWCGTERREVGSEGRRLSKGLARVPKRSFLPRLKKSAASLET
jgi:hypothetical protein